MMGVSRSSCAWVISPIRSLLTLYFAVADAHLRAPGRVFGGRAPQSLAGAGHTASARSHLANGQPGCRVPVQL